MTIDAAVELQRGEFRLDAHVCAEPGELVVLVGPNGGGKTTFLRALAGLERIDKGSIEIDGKCLDDGDSRFVPPYERGVGLVPQSDLLLPHLTAHGNIALGLRSGGMNRADAFAEATRWLETVGLGPQANLRPDELSGGQSKRVALARALAIRPRLLLLDEPFAGLDATARRDARREVRTFLDAYDGCRILVTHDPIDALAMADRIVVLEGGRVTQDVSPDELRSHPRSRYVADLVGLNLYRGTLSAQGLRTGSGIDIVAGSSSDEEGDGLAAIHPRSVALHLTQPEGSPRNVWRGSIAEIDDEGDRLRVRVTGDLEIVAEITRAASQDLELAPGTTVFASVKATEVALYPA